ncbi:MAG TPA: type VI secretion system baseplate subunit TssG [Sedimentisphaerales bacterium]|nr:type VI secretion system baseplate subunit TssG [Sedimentisphaerales bacterium]
MEDQKRAASDSLAVQLLERPYDFDFFQAVRRLECANAALPRIGNSQRPQGDPVRFCQNVSLAFPPSALQAYSALGEGHPARLTVNFFGLLGTNGPLPLPITEYVYDRLHNHKDRTLASFLDVFNHRMISLFYRAWACNQQTVSHDRKEEDRFAVYIGGFFGIGTESFRDRDAVPDVAKLHYSGRLVCQTRNAEGLREILEDYFGINAQIAEFVGQWLDLPQEYWCRMGQSAENGKLGQTVVIGSRFWECQQKFRIKFGPMNFADYQRLLPGGDSIRRLIAWVKNYVADELKWELQLILRAEQVPRIRLGKLGQLGWSTWLSSKRFEKDADDLVLRSLVA